MPRLIVNVIEKEGALDITVEQETENSTNDELAYINTLEGVIKRTQNSPPFDRLLYLQKQKLISK
ncbi:hypothetical protein [Photobacterium damselae]|uniref:Uncharacterized protein n=1 Tax=Photobacterium damselae subsp. damselae TaxID=85581 RepID=A0AAD3ZVV9_PHODD|nr:hypothetical protein [Photobacterium damselae]KAB1181451.1 hypothetical protein F6450_08855 [Photobacterium damselae subsp. damselae]PSB86705.1 hypothetical protein C5F62_02140 [Photobacterium damselae subsp. damselae]PSB88651.1 hypothetical protein C5F63_07415 [Photobacterium damselae subsp. damselae]UKA31009.1 hypothetical protein IPQ37_19880 [Photobacterium damselae subsp. damselae]SUB90105.1 Uncharacterised protein [Photobacterium damselae]